MKKTSIYTFFKSVKSPNFQIKSISIWYAQTYGAYRMKDIIYKANHTGQGYYDALVELFVKYEYEGC